MRERYPDLGLPEKRDPAMKSRLFEAIARLTLALAARQPILFFIDDVQWADAASLDVLHYLARRWAVAGTPAMLLVTVRSEFRHPTAQAQPSPVISWLAQTMRELPSRILDLGALTPEDTQRLVVALAGEQASVSQQTGNPASAAESFGKELFRETGGQPFFIVETLKALQERGTIAPRQESGGTWVIDFAQTAASQDLHGFVAPGVRAMLSARMASLTPDAATLLVAGVVLGRDFDFEALCAVAGMTEESALSGFEELAKSRLIREVAGGDNLATEGRYIFAHDKIRDVAYAEAGAPASASSIAAPWIPLLARNAPPAELAHHAVHAGQSALAFHLSIAAGDAAMRLFAVQDAIAHYEQAHSFVQGQGGRKEQIINFSGSDLRTLYSQLGRAYELTNEWEKVRSTYAEMLALARS